MDYFPMLSPDSHLLGTDIITPGSPWRTGACKLLILQPGFLSAWWYFCTFQLKMHFFAICISLLKNKTLFVWLIHMISLRLSVLDLEILIYIYLNLGLKYSILHRLLSFNSRERWTIFGSYKIRFLFSKCDQLSNRVLCGCGFAGNIAQQALTRNLPFEEYVLYFSTTRWQ